MNDTEIKVLKEYHKAKVELALAEENVKNLQEVVAKVLVKNDGKAEIPEAKFHLTRKAVYEYSPEVKKIESTIASAKSIFDKELKKDKEVLKAQQKAEELNGTAKLVSESFTPVWKALE